MTWLMTAGMFALATLALLVQATHGLLLLAALPVGVGWWWRRRQQAVREAVLTQEAAIEAQRRRDEAAAAQAIRAAAAIEYATDLGRLLTLTPTQFEQAAGHILEAAGYQLAHHGKTGDRGVDLAGSDHGGQAVIVQCKLYAPHRRVGGPEVRAFLGAMRQHRATVGLFVTTAEFTAEARTAAEGQPISLINGHDLVTLARNATRTRGASIDIRATADATRGRHVDE